MKEARSGVNFIIISRVYGTIIKMAMMREIIFNET